MRIVAVDGIQVPDKPAGYVEYERFFGSDIVGDEVPKMRFPIIGKLDRCERTASGWCGYSGETKFDATEDFKHDDKPDHIVVADKAGRLIGAVVLNWKRQRKPRLKAVA